MRWSIIAVHKRASIRLNHLAPFALATVGLAICPTMNAQFGGVFVCANCASEPTAASIKIMHDSSTQSRFFNMRFRCNS